MKKIIIILVVIILVTLSVLSYFWFFATNESEQDNTDVLLISTKKKIEEYIESNNINIYGFDASSAYISGVNVFGQKADVEFRLSDNKINEIDVCYNIFSYEIEIPEVSEDHEYNEDVIEDVIFEFSDEDKSKISSNFENIKKRFEEYIGCSFTAYDIIQTHAIDSLEDTDENFFNGDFVKEYSVRDSNGILWIMCYEASYGSASVIIEKIIDETEFTGFIPIIDLTKNN